MTIKEGYLNIFEKAVKNEALNLKLKKPLK
jgi:hypothetical protein